MPIDVYTGLRIIHCPDKWLVWELTMLCWYDQGECDGLRADETELAGPQRFRQQSRSEESRMAVS